jgi:hypothetical protein
MLWETSTSTLFLTIEVDTPFRWALCFILEDEGAGWLLKDWGSKQLVTNPYYYLLLNICILYY